jgi:transposase
MGLWIRCGNENTVFTWVGKDSPRPKKERRVRSNVSHFDGFFLTSRMLCIMNSYVRANSESLVLSRSAETSKRICQDKRRQLRRNNSWFLHHDCASSGITLIRDFLANTNTTVLPQPPYSPELAPQASQWFVTFWPTRTQLCFLSHPTHLTWLLRHHTDSWLFGQHEHNCASSATILTWPGSSGITLIRDFLANTNTTVLPQPPYSPDLAPADFLLFPTLKSTLKGRFQTIQEITENSQKELPAIPKKAYQDCF